ncbi:hypothetical protein LL946_07880 [Knoellia locipacati]|uniref:hypothetical protein n=1 Tax=Knoellia locipacati TaxID=882824 RepID=UPI00384F9212
MTPSSMLRARFGAALAGVAIALAAATVVAHSATRATERAPSSSAPADVPSPTASRSPVGPDATGPAAFGLCRAWANHAKHDDGKERAAGSVAMRNLAEAAGGESKVEAYCATVPHPSQRAKPDRGKGEKAGPKDELEKDEKAGPKDKVEKEPGKAGRSGKDKPAKPSPSASPSASSSPSGS